MYGVVLAGGTGSRLFPLTKVTNKHLLPIGNKPMIYYPIEKLIEAKINKIVIVTGTEHMGSVVQLLGSGKDFGCEFTYKVQDKAGGIAEALGLSSNIVNEKMVVILGDNIFEDNISNFVSEFREQSEGAKILLKEVSDPSRFGVPEFRNYKIVAIEEKPSIPKSKFCVTGIYMYHPDVFEIIKNLKPSQRGELEITSVNNHYAEKNTLTFNTLQGEWTDAGTFESFNRANYLVRVKNND